MFDMSSSERDSVRSVAKSLGLRPVGMVMLHFGRGSRDEKSTWCSSAKREFSIVSLLTWRILESEIVRLIMYYKKITRTPTLECTLEYYEKYGSISRQAKIDVKYTYY